MSTSLFERNTPSGTIRRVSAIWGNFLWVEITNIKFLSLHGEQKIK